MVVGGGAAAVVSEGATGTFDRLVATTCFSWDVTDRPDCEDLLFVRSMAGATFLLLRRCLGDRAASNLISNGCSSSSSDEKSVGPKIVGIGLLIGLRENKYQMDDKKWSDNSSRPGEN